MKIKTVDLTGAALDWAVTRANYEVNHDAVWRNFRGDCCYSTDWAQGGPIIEREAIELAYRVGVHWIATRVESSAVCEAWGPTQLVAAMRCYVMSQLGDEVEIPEELK